MREKYGKKYQLDIETCYQMEYGKTKVDIIFTTDNKALWMAMYKGEYYMSIIDEIDLDDKYRAIDIFTTLSENARDTIKQIKR